MPYKDPEKTKECNRKWYIKNKERKKEYCDEYRRKYPHIYKIGCWKNLGIQLRPNEDWLSVYLYWKTCEECENCGIQLTDGQASDSRTLDHDHSTGFIRNILCNACNIRRK